MNAHELLRMAEKARNMAYTPYSGFAVGAALLCEDGTVYTGCNIENASYSPTCCAERTAVFKAVSEGHTRFSAIAVVGGKAGQAPSAVCPPCGVCRQVLSEFCGRDFTVYLQDGDGKVQRFSADELLPLHFSL